MKSIALILAIAAAAIYGGCVSQASLQQSATAAHKAANRGDYKTAAEDLTPVVDADSQDPQAYMARAAAYFEAGENRRAIADVTRAQELEPDAAYYLLARSFGYSRTGQFDLALDDANSAIRLAPNTAMCYSQRGFVYMAMSNDQSAITDLVHAIKLDPNSVVYRVQLGFARGMAGDYAGARRAWETAIRMRPDYGPSHSALGWLQATCPDAQFRDAKKAVDNAKRGAELGAPTMLATLVAMGAVQINIQPKPDQNEPTLAWSLDALAAAYANAGDFRQAVAVQQDAIAHNKFSPNPLAVKEQKLLALYQQRKPYRAGFNPVVPSLPWIVLPS
ncbi:MAG: tetratricopeptide repeat protein [Candidatus Binataceae bacterium]